MQAVSEPLLPICEPVFTHMRKRYVAHCVQEPDVPTGVLTVCLYRVIETPRDTALEYLGHAFYSWRRFVSYVNGKPGGKAFRAAAEAAIRKELAG